MSKRGRWLRPGQSRQELARTAWLAVLGLDERYRRGAVEVWWERCEWVLRAKHPELTRVVVARDREQGPA